ncbi:MAG: glycosyltransferase [Candidatus Coproplasma sp.]
MDGPINVMVNVAKTFNEEGLGTAELLVPDYPEKIDVDGLTIHRCFSIGVPGQGYRAGLPFFSRKVKKLIKDGGFDVIHLQSPFTVSRYVLKLAKKYKIPVVITVHTKFRDEFEKRLKWKPLVNFMTNYILKCIDSCDAITSVSKGMVDVLKDYGSKRTDDVRVIINASYMPRFGADEEQTQKLRQELGLDGKFTFLFVGRLMPVKNVQFSLNVLKKVKDRGYNNFKYVIVGNGEYEKELRKLTQKLSLEDEVVFAGKVTDRQQLACYYSACQTLLFPSIFDNASIAMLEAAANGLPTAAIKGSCSAERLEDNVSGFVWENDETVWVENIIKLINNPSAALAAGRGAAEKVYADWNDVTKQYNELYNELIKRG